MGLGVKARPRTLVGFDLPILRLMPCLAVLLSLCQDFNMWKLVSGSLFRYLFVGENDFVLFNTLIFGAGVDH